MTEHDRKNCSAGVTRKSCRTEKLQARQHFSHHLGTTPCDLCHTAEADRGGGMGWGKLTNRFFYSNNLDLKMFAICIRLLCPQLFTSLPCDKHSSVFFFPCCCKTQSSSAGGLHAGAVLWLTDSKVLALLGLSTAPQVIQEKKGCKIATPSSDCREFIWKALGSTRANQDFCSTIYE